MTQPPSGGPAQPPGDQPTDHDPTAPGFPPSNEQPTLIEQPAVIGQPTPRSRRGLLTASIVLAAVLLLCGGGGTAAFLLLRKAETGEGAAEPAAAVTGFLTAVYTDQDATKAASLVCAAARDQKAITKKVDEVKKLSATYQEPRFNWTPPTIDDQNAERAIVSVKLTMISHDEKSVDQQLKFTVVQKTGWRVCEVA